MKSNSGETPTEAKPRELSARILPYLAALAPVLIVVAVAAAYGNTLRAPFVLDDLPSIAGNSSIRQ